MSDVLFSVGDVIVATWHPYEQQVIQAIHDFGLELQVILDKDAVMILPSGVNKMTGLSAALQELQLSHHNVVQNGDAENDHAFLKCCGAGGVAVANSIPSLKARADFVTEGRDGTGVVELANKLIETDPRRSGAPRLTVTILQWGKPGGREITIAPYGRTILVAGQWAASKSTLVTGLVQRAIRMEYQICLINPGRGLQRCGGLRLRPATQNAKRLLNHLKKMLITRQNGECGSGGCGDQGSCRVCAGVGVNKDRRVRGAAVGGLSMKRIMCCRGQRARETTPVSMPTS